MCASNESGIDLLTSAYLDVKENCNYEKLTKWLQNIEHMSVNTLLLPTRRLNGPLARYVKSRVAHASGMPGTFSPPPWISDTDMHHGTCLTHVPWCMPGSLTSGFPNSRWRGKRSQHSRCMRNPQFFVSGKRPMVSMPESTLLSIPS